MAIYTSTSALVPYHHSTSFACSMKFQQSKMIPTHLSYYRNHLKIDSNSIHKNRLSRSPPSASLDISAGLDLNINLTVHRSSLINPLEKAETRSMFLSNIDKMLNHNISSLFFFRNSPDYSFETVAEVVETAYQKILAPYYYLAGRLRRDEQGRLEVHCNFQGAGFVVASCDVTLEDLGDLACPRSDFKKFASRKLPGRHDDDKPLFTLQLTSLRCGGFVMGGSFNHMMFDGIGVKLFTENLASIARSNSLFLQPLNNRELLAARSPPQVKYPHTEFQKLEGNKAKLGTPLSRFEIHQGKAFRLSAEDIFKLKEEAGAGERVDHKAAGITTFNVIVAHIWRCLAIAINANGKSAQKALSLLYAVNTREILVPRLPDSFTGNAITTAICRTTYNELIEGSFSRLVQIVAEAKKRITDEYLRSTIDWAEMHEGFVIEGDILVTSIRNMGYTDVVYPWGKPIWHSPVMPDRGTGSIMLLRDTEVSGDGVTVLVSLGPTELHEFENSFRLFPRV